MSLRVHLIAELVDRPGTRGGVRTACGETGFKSLRLVYADSEWEADRRLGGLVAVREMKFHPRGACARCLKAWNAGAGI